jgi:hypothetical protein
MAGKKKHPPPPIDSHCSQTKSLILLVATFHVDISSLSKNNSLSLSSFYLVPDQVVIRGALLSVYGVMAPFMAPWHGLFYGAKVIMRSEDMRSVIASRPDTMTTCMAPSTSCPT